MTITTDRTTDYVVPSVADRAAEMGRALQEAQHALAAARQRLTAHTAQRPATAADVATWARRKAELTAEIEGYEGLVSDARTHAQQADAELKQQRRSDWYRERDRLADECDATFGAQLAAVNETIRVALAEIGRIQKERDAWIEEVWTPHARAAEQLGGIPFHEWRIVRLSGHGEITGAPLFVPRTGRKPPLL